MLGLGLSIPEIAIRGRRGFSPASLFANGEQGAWYDPADLTTLYSDSAGTTPVTAVEQPVGLMLDKSKGLVLGSELVTNGDFSGGTTGWTVVGGGSLSVESGRLRVTSNGTLTRARRAVTVTSGRWYKVSLEAYKGTAVNYLVYLGSSSGATDYLNRQSPDGAFTAYVYTTTTTLSMDLFCGTSTNGLYSEYDNISVRELAGNHAFNPNATTVRPTLSARKNILSNTETLATQTVAVRAVPHVLSFWGTGSVARSGTSSGTLAGTGAGDRVYVAFTPTAGNLTLTVTGTVTQAQLEEAGEGA